MRDVPVLPELPLPSRSASILPVGVAPLDMAVCIGLVGEMVRPQSGFELVVVAYEAGLDSVVDSHWAGLITTVDGTRESLEARRSELLTLGLPEDHILVQDLDGYLSGTLVDFRAEAEQDRRIESIPEHLQQNEMYQGMVNEDCKAIGNF